jgi:hypothetical protein
MDYERVLFRRRQLIAHMNDVIRLLGKLAPWLRLNYYISSVAVYTALFCGTHSPTRSLIQHLAICSQAGIA